MRNVESRRQDLANIERDITELSQMFSDLNLYIAEQQPTFDKVEELAQNTRTEVVNAESQVEQAIVSRKKSRKVMPICVPARASTTHAGVTVCLENVDIARRCDCAADCHRPYPVPHPSQMRVFFPL